VKYLLDTVVWLWSISAVERLNPASRELLHNGQSEIYFSAAISWEVSIKARLGKLQLPAPPADCIPAFLARQGLRPLPITFLHTVRVYDLPLYHHDPFDRLLIAQAICESMIVLSADRNFEKYPVNLFWCGK